MKTITLYDLAVMFGLQPYDEEIDPAFSIDTTLFNSIIIKSVNYGPFIRSNNGIKDEGTQAKYMTFLLIWVKIFILQLLKKGDKDVP